MTWEKQYTPGGRKERGGGRAMPSSSLTPSPSTRPPAGLGKARAADSAVLRWRDGCALRRMAATGDRSAAVGGTVLKRRPTPSNPPRPCSPSTTVLLPGHAQPLNGDAALVARPHLRCAHRPLLAGRMRGVFLLGTMTFQPAQKSSYVSEDDALHEQLPSMLPSATRSTCASCGGEGHVERTAPPPPRGTPA